MTSDPLIIISFIETLSIMTPDDTHQLRHLHAEFKAFAWTQLIAIANFQNVNV